MLLALKVERTFTKSTILGKYLNTVYFGHGAYGIEAAAQTYFGIPASRLTIPQSATLAGALAGGDLNGALVLEQALDRGDGVDTGLAVEDIRLTIFRQDAAAT